MKTLIIHPKDKTTDFLCEIYINNHNLKDFTLINHNCSKSFLEESIKNHDRIIMMGHGYPGGLFGFGKVFIDSEFIPLLKEKHNNVYIWCNADKFVSNYKLKGFATGMIISEFIEAVIYNIHVDLEEINKANNIFADCIKKSIYLDSKKMVENIKSNFLLEGSEIINFNKENIFLFE